MIKRFFDIWFSLVMLFILAPLFLFISALIVFDSRGGIFFNQIRVGRNQKEFKLWKFRTMRPMSEATSKITIGARDARITNIGYHLRKYKVDELPQLWNVLIGDMSLVGPRPEVPFYVALYTDEQKKVLSVRPGLTDYASLKYFNESELLAQASDPQKVYIEEVMPAKLSLNLEYVMKNNFLSDLQIILKTVQRIFST
jgi:lipopolysaccharide/colanic/teichoic acid biosynthesis glycosyltransferase